MTEDLARILTPKPADRIVAVLERAYATGQARETQEERGADWKEATIASRWGGP